MKLLPNMICCKEGRRQLGLACEPRWMAGCLAGECATLPTIEARRRFATVVASIRRLAGEALQQEFRDEVRRRYARRKAAK